MNRQALSAEERVLADKLIRSTPRIEPSAALDARILAQAQMPAATPSPRPRRIFGPGFGIAAAALLTAGLAWHMGVLQNLGLVHESTPERSAAPSLSRHQADTADATDSASALMHEARPEAMESAPAAAAAAPAPPPAPMAAPVPNNEAPISAFDLHNTTPADTGSTTTTASEPVPQAARARQADNEPDQDREAVTAPRRVLKPLSTQSDWQSDAKLPPEAWLKRIESHLQAGHTQAARESLRLFVRRHPGHAIPDELAELLHE